MTRRPHLPPPSIRAPRPRQTQGQLAGTFQNPSLPPEAVDRNGQGVCGLNPYHCTICRGRRTLFPALGVWDCVLSETRKRVQCSLASRKARSILPAPAAGEVSAPSSNLLAVVEWNRPDAEILDPGKA